MPQKFSKCNSKFFCLKDFLLHRWHKKHCFVLKSGFSSLKTWSNRKSEVTIGLGEFFFLLTSRVFWFKIGEKTRSFSLAQEVRMVWILIVKKNLIMNESLKLFFHLLNESCMDNIKKNWRWHILHFYFFWLQSHAVFCDKSRCKRNYKNASTELFSRKSFYFFFHNEVKKKPYPF